MSKHTPYAPNTATLSVLSSLIDFMETSLGYRTGDDEGYNRGLTSMNARWVDHLKGVINRTITKSSHFTLDEVPSSERTLYRNLSAWDGEGHKCAITVPNPHTNSQFVREKAEVTYPDGTVATLHNSEICLRPESSPVTRLNAAPTVPRNGYISDGWAPDTTKDYVDCRGGKWVWKGHYWLRVNGDIDSPNLIDLFEPYAVAERTESETPVDTTTTSFDRAVTYHDADKGEWGFVEGAWVRGESPLVRALNRRKGSGFVEPPASFGPYFRDGEI